MLSCTESISYTLTDKTYIFLRKHENKLVTIKLSNADGAEIVFYDKYEFNKFMSNLNLISAIINEPK